MAEEVFKQIEYHIQETQNLLKKEALSVRQEREAFDVVAKKLEHVHFSSTIKLNVGGQMFTTGLQTLTKDAGSMLHVMFSGRFDTKLSEDGSYFIDRDGSCFRYILNYLRTEKLLLPEDQLVRKEVLEEAMFYQIQGIIDELDPKHYSDSLILSSEQVDWLVNVHGDKKLFSTCSLLYCGSRDGWSSSMFHGKCDSFNGPTMVVIKTGEGYIFGGYTEQSWADMGFKADHAAFLFSLVSPRGASPVQVKAVQNQESAIYCNNSYGPTFGGAVIPVVQAPGSVYGSTMQAPGSVFGTTMQAPDSVFGSTMKAPGSVFGSTLKAPGSVYGSTMQAPGSVYGSTMQAPGSVFGSTMQAPGSVFGSTVQASRPSPPLSLINPQSDLYNTHDLAICSNPESNNCTMNLHHTYLCPGRVAAFMTEGHYFNVHEMEVFGLQK